MVKISMEEQIKFYKDMWNAAKRHHCKKYKIKIMKECEDKIAELRGMKNGVQGNSGRDNRDA